MTDLAQILAEAPSILLSEGQAALVEELVDRMAARTGESREQVRRAVQIAIVARGVAAVKEELL